MKLVAVESVPNRHRTSKHRLQDTLAEFINGESDIVRIELSDHDYKSAIVCYNCMYAAVKRSGYRIKVLFRDGNVYLTKM
jgi:hypothetical protein